MLRAHRLLGLATLLLAASGCMPSGIFSTARTLPPGELEHTLLGEITGTLYASSGDANRGTYRPGVESVSPVLGYAVRGGVTRRIELGGHLVGSAVELNGKLGLHDGESVALSLAPRVAASGLPEGDGKNTLVHARLPLLFTVEPTGWFSITPRVGVGFAQGRVREYGWERGAAASVSAPFGEAGLNLLFQVVPALGLSFEGYWIRSLARIAGQDFEGGGVGLGFVFGRSR